MASVDQTGFFQDGPRLVDEWGNDRALRNYLRRVLPADVLADVTPSLRLPAGDDRRCRPDTARARSRTSSADPPTAPA